MNKSYGKYRAIVTDVTSDVEKRGRIKVSCPAIYGNDESPYCEPCLPYAIENVGDFVLPKLNDFVWIEFEGGDIEKPIYTGGLWSSSHTPVSDYSKCAEVRQIEFAGNKILFEENKLVISNTENNVTITLEDGKVSVECDSAEFDAKGISFSSENFSVQADNVSINSSGNIGMRASRIDLN